MYVPNNATVYLRAFDGALAGMAASGRVPASSDDTQYALMADAWAQAVDIAFGVGVPTLFELQGLEDASQEIWSLRSPLTTPLATVAANYRGLAASVVALVVAGNAQVVAQGVNPNSGSSTLAVAGTGYAHVTAGSLDATAAHGSVAGQIPMTNAAVTDAPFVTPSGDVTTSGTGVFTVVGLQLHTILATTPLVAEMLGFDGTFWGPRPEGWTWHATLTHASTPFTPNPATNGPADLVLPCDTSGGALTVNTPASPYDGMIITIKPIVASATPIILHANNGGGETVEDPSNSGTFGANGTVAGQGPACRWKYRASDLKWIGWSNV